ncbi:MAG: EAL domain-containing protein [Tepidisphaeraceae bacterium]
MLVDDFGIGHSSLSTLRRFDLDGIKLDRSFLDECVTSRRTAAVIHSAITLARDLGMELIAEGVESLDQVALLQTLGCEFAQGYLFARPSSVDRFVALAQNRTWLGPIQSGGEPSLTVAA